MKSTLLSLITFFVYFTAFSQVPVNDDIADAIEITTTSFTDENLRLDLASNLPDPINGCDISTFKTVFYKFTAPYTGDASAVVLNQDGSSASGSIFAIFYTALNLNVTSTSELITSVSPCVLTPNATNLIITQGQSYYIAISRAEANVISRVEVNFEEVPIPINDQIIDATEITGSSFNDSYMRLDYATASAGGQAGCDTTQEVVFYKYTATSDAFVSLSLTNNSGNDSEIDGSSFIRVFEAPDLNVASESNLTLATGQNCNSEISVDVAVVSGQSYYFLVHRPDEFQFSSFNFEFITLQNDSILNATEITTSSFTESNLRLDLASESTGGQNGCSTTSKVLYYKFTADSSTKLFTKLTDDSGSSISPTVFVYIYEAPNLNVTLESDLTLASGVTCGPQTGANIDVSAGQSYYILIHRGLEFARTTFTFEIDVPQIEREALVEFYNSTGGNFWWFGENWNDNNKPVQEWDGVYTENGHVTSIFLNSDNLNGEIPNSILDLQYLESANFQNNYLSGEIPDFSSLPNLGILRINSNNFSFADFETNFENNSAIEAFDYSPQRLIDDFIIIENPVIGEDFIFTMTEQEGTDINYQWVKKATILYEPEIENVPGETSPTFNITNYQEEDASTYTCLVTSPTITGLIIERSGIKFNVPVSLSERDALIALYNATDGDNWTSSYNWLSSEPVYSWERVGTFENKVVYLNLNFKNLNGELPDEIGDLIHLRELRISGNPNMTGNIPSTIVNLTELEWLRLQGNLSGEIPGFLGDLPNLKYLYLEHNQYSGSIPANLGNATELVQLILEDNQLTGEIPMSIGNLSNLTNLSLEDNSLSGTIPASLSNLTSPIGIDLRNNNLSGELPQWSSFNNPEEVGIDIRDNYYSFSDLEPLVNNGIDYGTLLYNPQNTQDDEEELTSPPGVDIALDVNDTDINREAQDPSPNNVYQWFKDGGIIVGAITNPYIITNAQPSDSGVYHCVITNPLVPDLTIVRANITLTVEDNLSTDDFENDSFRIFPNPANNWISIKTSITSPTKAQIFDINGKLIFEKQLSSQITAIAIDQLATGTYVIKILSDNQTQTKRFIKQ